MKNKRPAFLREENLLTLFSQNNFIVPEIQREYVWGENEEVITKFLSDLKSKIGSCCSTCKLPNSNAKINIGFLYSYKPDYVKVEHERFLDENLIDGQQRFTTLFLLLFVCSLKENRKTDFLSLIRYEKNLSMSFDFRVRDLTRRFLFELVDKINNTLELNAITEQTWFLKDYETDVSIKSILKALRYIQSIFSDDNYYYNHFINNIVFWHFKTEATSQGEELYITMNARGEVLADNEVTKAAIMVEGSELFEWGKKWEEWQLFFWKHRNRKDKNQSSDNGLNGFLNCIAGLEYYIKERNGEKPEKDVQKLLTLELVEKHINSFKLLYECTELISKNYTYCAWVNKFYDDVWRILNENDTFWFADYQTKNMADTERNRMILLWSWLYYLSELRNDYKEIKKDELFRIVRFFYVRHNNNNRSVTTLKKTIDLISINGIMDTLDNEMGNVDDNPQEETDTKFRTSEETLKYGYLQSNYMTSNIFEIESLIWEIEDHPLNLDGKDVGGINISHLVDFNSDLSLDYLSKIKHAFFKLFPAGSKKGSSVLKSVLLHYGNFSKDTSRDYKRYDFSEWKRMIRRSEFKNLIKIVVDKSIEEHLVELNNEFISENREIILNSKIALPSGISLRRKLLFYSLLLPPDKFWHAGEKILITNDIPWSRFFQDEDQKIYNANSDFRSYYNDLWHLITVNNELIDPLSKIKEMAIL
jgi:hypothetical protein